MTSPTVLSNLEVEEYKLAVPPLDDIAKALKNGLKSNYESVDVIVTDCPDLRQSPFELPFQGLSGCESVIQCGDPCYVVPAILKDKIYDFKEIVKALHLKYGCIFGAGGGPTLYSTGTFSEMIAKGIVYEDGINNATKCGQVVKMEDGTKQESLFDVSKDISIFSVLGSLYCCQGYPGQVIKVTCKKRIGKEESFSDALVQALQSTYKHPMAFGTLFTQLNGKALHHLAPTVIPSIPLVGADVIRNWLTWPVLSSPYVSFGTLITKNPYNWKLQSQHFHSYNNFNQAGHYHNDTTPDQAEYLAYLSPANTLYAIDRPQNDSDLLSSKCIKILNK